MKKNKKLIFQRIAKVICFLLIFNILLVAGSMIFVPKANDQRHGVKNYPGEAFRGERSYTLDYVAVGNSSIYRSLSPMEIWKEYGYTGYICGEPSQDVPSAYYMLKEVFKVQSPKLVILEADEIFSATHKKIKPEMSQTRSNLCYISNEINQADTLISDKINEAFPLVRYHRRWASLLPEDFYAQPDYTTWRNPLKGYINTAVIEPYRVKKTFMKKTDKTIPIQFSVKCYLDKINALCKENGAELMLLTSPVPRSWNYARHNSVVQYAEENNLRYLDTNLCFDQIGLDWSTDTKDKGLHLNINGAKKESAFVGKYLSENFEFTDKRDDSNFNVWHEDYEKYLLTLEKDVERADEIDDKKDE